MRTLLPGWKTDNYFVFASILDVSAWAFSLLLALILAKKWARRFVSMYCVSFPVALHTRAAF